MSTRIKVDATVARALFNFSDDSEPGRLTFSKGDVIQIVQQLSSGWWDGIVHGKRGWFPSSYVTAPEQVKISPKKTYGWIRRVARDTNIFQYYNVLTGEIVKPADMEENGIHIATSQLKRLDLSNLNYSDYAISPGSPVVLRDDAGFDLETNVNECSIPNESHPQSVVPSQLPPNWGMKMTSDGRVYYYNTITNETRWNIVDSESSSVSIPSHGTSSQINPVSRNLTSFAPKEVIPRTWEAFQDDIITKISILKESALAKQKNRYLSDASAIVQSIHFMMTSSETLERDSSALRSNKMLALHHRNIMKALSKLVSSAKLAASVWPQPDAPYLMSSDANEVLLAVRHFTSLAAEIGISILNVTPTENMGKRSPSLQTSRASGQRSLGNLAEIMSALDQSPSLITEAIIDLHRFLSQNQIHKYSSEVVSKTRRIVNEVGQLLAVMEEIETNSASLSVVHEFEKNKQALYNSITGLVSSTTAAIGPISPIDALDQIIDSSTKVERSVVDLVVSGKYLIEETTAAESIDNCGSNGRHRKSSDLSIMPRRALSLSNPTHDGSEVSKSQTDMFPLDIESSHTDTTIPSLSADSTSSSFLDGNRDDVRAENGRIAASSAPTRRSSENSSLSPAIAQKIFRFEKNAPESLTHLDSNDNWFLSAGFSERDIVYSMEGNIKGATLPVLVERVTSHESFDADLVHTFLLTYRSFTYARELFSLLVRRFDMERPAGLTDLQKEIWLEKKQKPIRLRVFHILKLWVESFFYDDDDFALIGEMRKFAGSILGEHMPLASEQLLRLLDKRKSRKGSNASISRSNVPLNPRDLPAPILPRNLKRIKLFDIDPLELARQITVMESKLFCEIEAFEFLNKAWSDKENNFAPHIKKMIEATNQITGWVAESILMERDTKKRCSVMKYFIMVGDSCRSLKNYNALMAILAALNSSQIHRLKRTRELLSAKTTALLEECKAIMSPNQNFSNYRAELKSVESACVPFLGMYLTDLTFIEDGNSDRLKALPHLINFDKRIKTADKIKEIQQYQNPYPLLEVPEMQAYLGTCLASAERDPEQMYQKSLQLEPREREDEKIARLLLESGFL